MTERLAVGLLLLVALPAAAQPAFERLTTTLPTGLAHVAAAPADYDGDGDLDLLAVRTDGPLFSNSLRIPVLYRNDGVDAAGVLVLTEVAFPAPPYPAAQLGWDPEGEALTWSDFDGDGDSDPLVATPYGSALYRNDDGVFTEAVALPGFTESSWGFDLRSALWSDADNDGDADLFFPESVQPENQSEVDSSHVVLYRNDGGALTPTEGPFPYTRFALHLLAGDVDGDRDLLQHDTGWNCSEYGGAPGDECVVLFDNDGGVFTALPVDFPDVWRPGMSDLADFDLDGDLDILLASTFVNEDGPPFTVDRAYVYRNDGGAFVPGTLDLALGDGQEFSVVNAATFADYDSDATPWSGHYGPTLRFSTPSPEQPPYPPSPGPHGSLVRRRSRARARVVREGAGRGPRRRGAAERARAPRTPRVVRAGR